MNKISRLSAVVAVLAATATFASADTLLGSYGATNPGFNNTAIKTSTSASATDPGNVTTPPSGSAVAILPNSSWTAAGSAGGVQSSWISFEAGTGAGPTTVAPDGYYTYYTTFNLTTQSYGSLSVLADDTTDVWLNGHLVTPEADTISGDSNTTCETDEPDCTHVDTLNLSAYLTTGTNVLVFNVEQTHLSSTGLDFYGDLSTVPEPSTLLMLGTGLVGAAGTLFRRMRS
jgi:hypothetical protein